MDYIIGTVVLCLIIWYSLYEMKVATDKEKKFCAKLDVKKALEATSKNGNYIVPKIDYREKQEYLQSEEWKKLAKQVRDRDDYLCRKCGKFAYEVHHLRYVNFQHEPLEDLVCICRKCHEEVHKEYGYYNKKDSYPI